MSTAAERKIEELEKRIEKLEKKLKITPLKKKSEN